MSRRFGIYIFIVGIAIIGLYSYTKRDTLVNRKQCESQSCQKEEVEENSELMILESVASPFFSIIP